MNYLLSLEINEDTKSNLIYFISLAFSYMSSEERQEFRKEYNLIIESLQDSELIDS